MIKVEKATPACFLKELCRVYKKDSYLCLYSQAENFRQSQKEISSKNKNTLFFKLEICLKSNTRFCMRKTLFPESQFS